MIKELYLSIAEAALEAKCTERALLQHGAEGILPVYAKLTDFTYLSIMFTERSSDVSESVTTFLKYDHDVDGQAPPLNGWFLVTPSCLDSYNQDPDRAILSPVYYKYDENGEWINRWEMTSISTLVRNTPLRVLTSDLKKAGLLADDTNTSLLEFVDDPRWPEELDIAIAAWIAARKELTMDKRPGIFIEQWLKKHYPTLPPEQAKRIKTIANWNKKGGRPPNKE